MRVPGYKAVEDDSEPLDGTVTKEEWVGRCRCVGQGKGDMRVVCACTKPDDLWRKGPYSVVTGYTVVYDKHDDVTPAPFCRILGHGTFCLHIRSPPQIIRRLPPRLCLPTVLSRWSYELTRTPPPRITAILVSTSR